MTQNLTIAGLFAGVGGIEKGFSQAGFRPVVSNELDRYASITFRENNVHQLIEGDIKELPSSAVPKGITVLAGGFPCQPFSVAGYRKGFDDDRGNVFWEIDRLYGDQKPQVVFLENVKNLRTHDSGNTFSVIKSALEDRGYTVIADVLNAKDYSMVPQNRERMYIVAFKDPKAAKRFSFPEKIGKPASINKYIDFNKKVPAEYYYGPSTPFYERLVEEITEKGTVYQWRRQYVRANKSGVSPTLTANMGMGGHNVPIILTKYGIRKLTPEECFRLMGFEDFKIPGGLAKSHLYKQAGNSVVVPVIARIAESIKRALIA
jgi:DNA (cytosine-5)-methyltransferase 1